MHHTGGFERERQKGMFKHLIYSLIEDDPEAQELFE